MQFSISTPNLTRSYKTELIGGPVKLLIVVVLSSRDMNRAAVLFSGGKDSVYAAYIARQQCMELRTALTVVPFERDSQMFHVPNIYFASVVSSAMGIPNTVIEANVGEDEIDVLGDAIAALNVDTVVTGAIASDYQATRIDQLCFENGIRVFSPLWHKDQEMLLREMIAAEFRIVVVGTFAEGLEEAWLGRELNLDALGELVRISEKRSIHIGGEGGEIETIVLDGPGFVKSLEIASSEKKWFRDSGYFEIRALRQLWKKTKPARE